MSDNPYGPPGDQPVPPPPGSGGSGYGYGTGPTAGDAQHDSWRYDMQQPGYAQPAYGQPPYGFQQAQRPYAHWGLQVGAFLIDGVIAGVPAFIILLVAGAANSGALALLAYLVGFAIGIWNLWRQGTTGATVGKSAFGIQVIKDGTGQYLGGWLSIGRQILHIVDSIPCYVGYLWPLWDAKRQTFADKIVGSVVVRKQG